MKKLVLLSLAVIASFTTQAQQDCSDLFISEYVVGSGNNRALELYNPTANAIDLGTYKVGRFRDGSGTPMLLNLAGTIPSHGTYVIVVDKRNASGTGLEAPVDMALQAVADTFVNPTYVQSNSPFYFNGDDAVPLIKGDGTVLVDLVGKIGEDPGTAWSDANGSWWTTKHTLIRKSTILKGDIDGLNDFLPEVEWDSLPENTFTELGWHTCDCSTLGVSDSELSKFNVFPNPAVDKHLMISASQDFSEIQVFNILGQEAAKVTFEKTPASKHQLKLDHLTTGIYIVRVSLRNGAVLSRKVMLGK
ncbi:MAG: lamin tail domain-containing protein [Flavobacteriales bacterium]|nr:lamin tail domain-containing protein [Flavobacteriales bacterium]